MTSYLKYIMIGLMVVLFDGCTQNQIGTATGGAVGAGVGYAVSKNAWGSAIGGGAGALIGHELSNKN